MSGFNGLKEVGLGISRFLRYSYAGCLSVVVMAYFEGDFVNSVRLVIGDSVSIFAVIVVGAGVYSFHRGFIIPLHHFLGIGAHRVFEDVFCPRRRGRAGRQHSMNPVIFLRACPRYQVPRFLGIRAYSRLRAEKKGKIFGDTDAINLLHAHHGFLVMTATACLVAGLYEFFSEAGKVYPGLMLLAGAAIWLLSYIPSMMQHADECLELRQRYRRATEEATKAAGPGASPADIEKKATERDPRSPPPDVYLDPIYETLLEAGIIHG
jgi:hypothetical protein